MNPKENFQLYASARMGDHTLILGQRLAEWCGHGPILEQDIAVTNLALDLIGQARNWYNLAASMHPNFKNEDDFAFQRNERQFFNFQITELPNGDWAQTVLRQFFFDAWHLPFLQQLENLAPADVAGIAAKAVKEVKYHYRWSSEWVIRLGIGTEESHQRLKNALDELWPFTGEWFETEHDHLAQTSGWPTSDSVKSRWRESIHQVFEKACIPIPVEAPHHTGSSSGIHTEHMGYILAEMQYLPRQFPGASW